SPLFPYTPLFRSRDDRPAVVVATERLGRKEARCSRRGEDADAAILVCCTEGLRSVIEHEQVFPLRDRDNAIVVRGLPEQINRYDSFRTKPGLARRGACSLQACGIQIEASLLDVGEDGRSTDQRHDFGSRSESKARAD